MTNDDRKAPFETIGPYRIREQLGEGGMAVVYLAEQTEPVKRFVALKILKPGMDSKQIVARFESERQALAVLDHPNIAKIYDGGIAENGIPYFVMDYVKGVPITQFCDEHCLSTAARLKIFIDVCHAAQHAHVKGLIHRDLKPSNILVGLVDGTPQPKIIDFGIAKATDTTLTDATQHTRVGQIIGTPHYMSPEQTGLAGVDIDTRADIYSLGVVLYELLVGTLPLDLSTVRDIALPGVIREKIPPKPSTRFTSLGATRDEVALARDTSAHELGRQLKGDLDWVVMKAIEKDRTRRYETVNALAIECQRYLSHQPVLARPPHAGYLFRRFVRRNRVIVAAASAVTIAIVVGGITATVSYLKATEAEQAARRTAEFLIDIFEAADPSESTGGRLTAKHILDQGVERLDEGLVGQAVLRIRLRTLVARAYKGIGLYSDAESLLRRSLNEASGLAGISEREQLGIRFELADVLFQRGNMDESEALHAEVRSARLERFGDNDVDTVASLSVFAHELWRNGDISEAANLFKKVLSFRRDRLGDQHPEVLDLLSTLGTLYYTQGIRGEAAVYYREAADRADMTYGKRHVKTAIALSNLAIVESDPEVRESLLLRSLSIRQDVFGNDHHLVARAEEILANFYAEQGQTERADSLYRQAIAKLENAEERTPVLPTVQNKYARFLESQQRFAEALDLIAAAHRNFAEMVGISHSWTLRVRANQAYLHYIVGESETAENILRGAIEIAESAESASPFVVADIKMRLAEVELDNGELDEAIKLAKYSMSVYSEDPDVHRVSLAISLGLLGKARLASGEPDLALAHADRALALTSGESPLALADYRSISGLAQAAMGDCTSGLPLLDSATTAISESSMPDKYRAGIARRINQGHSLCDGSSR